MRKKIITIALIALGAVCLAALSVRLFKMARINSVSLEPDNTYTVNEGEEIELGNNDVKVSESENRILYVNPASLNIIVEDKETGERFPAVLTGDTATDLEKSLVIVNFVGKDNAFEEWDSYTKTVANESFTLKKIDNGVRVSMSMNEGASERFYEYLPQKMSVEHFQMFKDGLEKAVEDGVLEASLKKKYNSTLTLVYKKSKQDECYNCTYVGNPPMSACRQLIAMAEMVGYTRDMLLEDAKKYGFTVEFKEPAVFDLVLDFTLDGDDLVVNMPSDKIVSRNEFFTITNIEVLPNFGMVQRADVTEGYLMVPDGCGALMRMNTYNPKVPDYQRPVYDNDFYKDYLYTPEFSTELMMPVFGVIYKAGTKEPFGTMGIIESGSDYSYIEAMLASSDEMAAGRLLNKVYASYDVSQYEWVPVFGEFATNTTTFLSIMPKTSENLRIRYKLYPHATDYYEMARDYGQHVFESADNGVYHDNAKLFLEVYGTLSTTERVVGVPYNSLYPMTTYKELSEILNDLNAGNINISYLGAFDGGKNNMLMNKGKLVKKNGSKKGYEDLKALVSSLGSKLYLGTDFMRIWDRSGNGYTAAIHGDEDYTKHPMMIYGTDPALGTASDSKLVNMMLKPVYLPDVVNDFLKGTDDKNADYYVAGLTHQYYADYGNKAVTPQQAQTAVNMALDSLQGAGSLALDCPRADKWRYGTVAVDIPRDSSEYAVFYCTIPFMQLAMNGMCEYTTVTANNNSMDYDYFLMQALETGAELKFTVSSKSVDILRDTEYAFLYSIQYDLIKDEIKETYGKYVEAMKQIGTSRITGHRTLSENVFVTEYESGAKVYTNYNGIDQEADGVSIPANGYVICR